MKALAAAIAALVLVAPAWAAPAPAWRPHRIFISPSGEPFRLGPDDSDPLKAWFDEADTKHQGYIDRAEFRADAARFFKKLDENGDGVIDGFETADYEAKMVPELGEWADGRFPGEFAKARRNKGPVPQPAGGIARLIDEPEPVTGADFNLDGRITFAEWMRASGQRFDLLDTAKTGRLTLPMLRERLEKLERRR